MADDFLRSIDSHLASIDSHIGGIDSRLEGIDSRLEGIDSRLEGIDEEMRLGRESREESDRRYQELVGFTHQLMLRNDRMLQKFGRSIDRLNATIDRVGAEAQASTKGLNDLTKEMRAQRQGFLALIDEMRGSGPATA